MCTEHPLLTTSQGKLACPIIAPYHVQCDKERG